MPTAIETVVSVLNENISLEHGAIVQYLLHAYAMGEGGVGAEVINIARTEMRHLKMFGDLLVDLGGSPDVYRRGPMHLDADSATQMMRNGVQAEEDAIAAYEAALVGLDHPHAQRVIERVLEDERFHHLQFAGFEREVGEVVATLPVAGPADLAAAKVVALLDPAVRAAYAAILRNVREYLKSREFRHRDRMLEPMIWSMKHVGLLADEIHENGGMVDLLDLPDRVPDRGALEATQEMLASEQDRLALYGRIADEQIDPGLKRLLANLMSHQRYNAAELGREVDRLVEHASAGLEKCPFHSSQTVGSLLGDPQG